MMAYEKLETNIVEKTSFCCEKENNLIYILCCQLSLTTNVMFCK